MLFKVLFSSGRILQSVKGKFRSDVKATWHLRDSAVVLSTVAQPLAAPLPRLPVPSLLQTFQKFLKTVRPLVSDEEYLQTEKLVKEFITPGAIGEKLQFLLQTKAEKTENWLSEWWLNNAYLDFRSPLVLFSSPGLIFPPQQFFRKDDQLRYAARLIRATLDFKRLIDENQLPMEYSAGKPLDMSQYFKILSTCRIPGVKRDSLEHFGMKNNPPTHIIVAHNNHFFKCEVYAQDKQILSLEQIEDFLRKVVSQSLQSAPPVGILTTENRDVWGKVYKKLKKDKQNKKSVDEIERGIFVVCLDQPNKFMQNVELRTRVGLQMLHGNGSENNGGNRWFDKTIQFIIGADGEVGISYEHSPAEGPPITALMDFVLNQINSGLTSGSPVNNPSPPKRLDFNVGVDLQDDIKNAQNALDKLVKNIDFIVMKFNGFGKGFIKSQKLSPDSFIQMAIQLAFYRIHGVPGACYESASTRQFIGGRTENIRSTSLESLAFCKAMLDSSSNLEKVQLMRKAVESHKKYASDSSNGLGVDRHLLGLKLIALENGLEPPRLFSDKGYAKSSHFRLSTSQVPAKNQALMCYGPLVPDGYGCCYNPQEKIMFFGISSCNECPETSAEKFREALEKSLTDMHNVLTLTHTSKL